jgi:hypothetical protein
MAIDYFLLIVVGFFGVLQVVASHSGLYGLRLFSNRTKGYVVGVAIAASAFAWFFATGNRNIEGHITGVQGSEQFGLFLAGVCMSSDPMIQVGCFGNEQLGMVPASGNRYIGCLS